VARFNNPRSESSGGILNIYHFFGLRCLGFSWALFSCSAISI